MSSKQTAEFYDSKVKKRLPDRANQYGSELIPVCFRAPYRFAEQQLAKFANGRKLMILDLCCGTGGHSLHQVIQQHQIIGLDISLKSLQIADEQRQELSFAENALFALARLDQSIPCQSNSFDAVFISGGLYYLQLAKILPEINRVLKPDGLFIGIETNGSNFLLNYYRRLKNIIFKHRDQQTLNKLLGITEIKALAPYFSSFEVSYFDFFTLFGKFLPEEFALKLNKPLRAIDRLILHAFFAKLFAFKMVFKGSKSKL